MGDFCSGQWAVCSPHWRREAQTILYVFSPLHPPLTIFQAQEIKNPGVERSSQVTFILPCPRSPLGASLADSTPCLHPPQCGSLLQLDTSQLSPTPQATRRQGVNEASSSTPLIDCKILLRTTHLALVINWGFLPDLRHDLRPPKDKAFSAGVLQLEPSLHTGLQTGSRPSSLRELPQGASPSKHRGGTLYRFGGRGQSWCYHLLELQVQWSPALSHINSPVFL